MSEQPTLSILIQAFDQTQTAFKSVGQSLSTLTDKVDSAGSRMILSFQRNMETITKLSNRIMSLTHVFMTFWILMDRARDHQISLKRSQIALTEVTWKVEEAQRNLNSAIAEFGPTSEEARKAAERLWLAQEELRLKIEEITIFQKGFNNLLAVGLVGAFGGAITAITSFLTYFGGPAGLYAAWITLHDYIDDVLFALGNFGLAVVPFGIAVASYGVLLWMIEEDFLGLAIGIRMALGDLTLWLEDPLRYKKIPEVWQNLWDKMELIANTSWDSLKLGWMGTGFTIVDMVGFRLFPIVWAAFWKDSETPVSDACHSIRLWFEGLGAAASSWGEGLVNGFVNGLNYALPGLGTWFVTTWDSIKEGFVTLYEDAHDWGKKLVENFIDGLLEAIGLEEAAGNIPRTIGFYWGTGSPAKKGALSHLMEWAPNLIETYAKGLEAGIPRIAEAAGKIAAAARLGGATGSGVGVLGSTLSNRSLTIGAIQVNVTNSGSTADEIADAIYRQVQRLL